MSPQKLTPATKPQSQGNTAMALVPPGTAYPTLRCPHCSLVRCFPGGSSTCWEWPGSECPKPTPPPELGYDPYLSGDGLKYWDREAAEWKNL